PTGSRCSSGVCCPPGTTNCGGACVNLQTDARNCGTCGTTCGAGQACCNGVCTALNTTSNCGACGHACAAPANATATCTNGACGYACLTGFADCDGQASNGCEVNLKTDSRNCGACGHVCPAGKSCVNGVCPCPTGP